VLLTDTIEATTVGNSILMSRGLIDSLPNEEAIASVIAMELVHIAMGHPIDKRPSTKIGYSPIPRPSRSST
jgi:predicted Zn-dependent protease